MSFSDLSIPFLVSNNNENPLQQQQRNNTTHQRQVEKENDNDNDDKDAIRFGTNYHFRSFFLGVSVVFLFTLIVSTATITLNHTLVSLLLVDDEQQEEGSLEEQTQYTTLLLLLLEDVLAYCVYIIHFLVCVCWLVVLLALVISGTPLSELKQASSIRAILFIAGLFYGVTLVTMFFQLYYSTILPQEQQHGKDKVLDDPLTTTTAEVGVVGEGVVPSFWFSMLMGILHQGILLAAIYNAFRLTEQKGVDAAFSEGSSDDNDAAAGNKITNIIMKKTEKELRGRTSTRNNKIIYYDNDGDDEEEALMIV